MLRCVCVTAPSLSERDLTAGRDRGSINCLIIMINCLIIVVNCLIIIIRFLVITINCLIMVVSCLIMVLNRLIITISGSVEALESCQIKEMSDLARQMQRFFAHHHPCLTVL